MLPNKTPITTALVGINVAVFVAMIVTGVSPVTPTTAQLLQWGANWGPLSLGPQPWRLLSSNYVHAGILHIGLNMWCLWNLGFLAERIFDPWTYVLTYTACGLAGSIASLWLHPMTVGVGASGAIFGLAGALIAALYLGHLPIAREAIRGTLRSLLAFAGYNLFFGAVAPFIDNSAHVGGLVCGLAIGALLAKHLVAPPEVRKAWRGITFIAAAVILLVLFQMVKRQNGGVLPPVRQVLRTPYSVPASSSSLSLTVSTACPRTAKVNLSSAGERNETRGGRRCQMGDAHPGWLRPSLLVSPIAFLRTGLRRPSCITTANSFLPSSEIPQYAT